MIAPPYFSQSKRIYRVLTWASRLLIACAFSSEMLQAQPINDSFQWAIDLGTSPIAHLNGSTVGATFEPNEPPNPGATGSAWFKWTPTTSGWLYPTVSGAYNFPDLWIYRDVDGSLEKLELSSKNMTNAYVFANTTYYLAAYDHGALYGDFFFALQPFVPPANDNFANAIGINLQNGFAEMKGWTIAATREPDEPFSVTSWPELMWGGPKNGGVQTVWYKWQPMDADEVEVSLEYLTAELSVFRDTGGGLASLETVAELWDSRRYTPGETYYIAVNNTPINAAPFTLRLKKPAQSPYDNFANAWDLYSPAAVLVHYSTVGSSLELGEAHPAGSSGSVWFRVTASSNGRAYLEDQYGRADFQLYSGDAVDHLVRVDPPDVVAGATYYIAANNRNGVSSPFRLFLEFAAPPGPRAVPNDDIADATVLTGWVHSLQSDSWAGTRERGEFLLHHATRFGTLWWKYIPPESGSLAIYGGTLGDYNVFRGDPALRDRIAASNGGLNRAQVEAGQVYYVQVQADDLSYPGVRLLLNRDLSNRTIENATEISANKPELGFTGATPAWFVWTAPADGSVTIPETWRPIETAVYKANSPEALEPVSGNPFRVRGGEKHYFRVSTPRVNEDVMFEIELLFSSDLARMADLRSTGGLPAGSFSDEGLTSAAREVPLSTANTDTFLRSPGLMAKSVDLQSFAQTLFTDRIGQTLEIFRGAEQEIKVSSLPPISRIELFGASDSRLPIDFSVISGPGSISGNVLTLSGPGRVVVRGAQPGDRYFAPGALEQAFSSKQKAAQTIQFDPPGDVSLNSGPITLRASASSGLPVTFTLVAGDASLSGDLVTIRALGQITIRASQAGNDEFTPAADVERSFEVSKIPQSIQFDPLLDVPFGTAPFSLSASASSGLPVSFTILSGQATLAGNLLSIHGAGSVVVRASQGGNEQVDFALAVDRTFTVTRAVQTLQFPALPPVRFGDAPINLAANTSSGLPPTFEILSGPASLLGNVLTLLGAGVLEIRAAQAGNDNFLPASDLTQTVSISKAAQTINFEPPTGLRFGAGAAALHATASSGLPVNFEIISGLALVDGVQLRPIGAGSVVVRAVQAGDVNYEPVSIEQTLEILKAEQVITIEHAGIVSLGAAPFDLKVSSNSGLPVTLELISGPALLKGYTLSATGTGSVLIRAHQAGDANFLPGTAMLTLEIQKASQIITFSPPATLTPNGAYQLSAVASSGLPVSFELISGPASLLGNVLTISGIGVIRVKALQEGDATYNPASPIEQTIEVRKTLQTIFFEPPPGLVFGAEPVPLNASSSSGLPVVLEIVSGKGTLNGNTLAINGAGKITLRATQLGNEFFEEAPPVERILDVARAAQTITFSEVSAMRVGGGTANIYATASTGLPVTLEIVSGPALLEANTLSPTGSGPVLIRASQGGNFDYLPAAATLAVEIGKVHQTVVFTPATAMLPNGSLELSATASSGLPVTFRLVSGSGEIVEGNILTASGPGTLLIQARQDGNATYQAASVEATISAMAQPELGIRAENGALILSTAPASDAFELQSAASLEGPWTPATNSLGDSIQIHPGTFRQFFRLKLR
jgi:hypothetical protein